MPLPENLEADSYDLWLRFESNNVIDVDHLAKFLREISRLARTKVFYGRGATVTLRRLSSDSPTTILIQVLDVAGNLAGVGQLGIGILMLIQERKGHQLAKALAVIMTDDDVYELSALFRDPSGDGARRVAVSREQVPAVLQLAAEREIADAPEEGRLPKLLDGRDQARDWLLTDETGSGSFARSMQLPSQTTIPDHLPGSTEGPNLRTSTFATQRVGGVFPGPDRKQAVSLLGTFNIYPDGTAFFKTGNAQFRVNNPGVELDPVPIGPEVVVEGQPIPSSREAEAHIHVFSARPLQS